MTNNISHNVDLDEIEKFEHLSSEWWDVNGKLRTLHHINPARLRFIDEKYTLTGKHVIDIGCGGGILAEAMSKKGAAVTGIDLSGEAIFVAQNHSLKCGLKIEYKVTTAEAIAKEQPAYFDSVTCLEMLEHVPNPELIVKACAMLVKPGGHVFLSTINRSPKAYLFAILGAEYLLKLLPKNTHDYAKFIKPSELANWCRQAGLTPKETKGLHYNPINEKASLNSDVSVNYLMHAIKNS